MHLFGRKCERSIGGWGNATRRTMNSPVFLSPPGGTQLLADAGNLICSATRRSVLSRQATRNLMP